MTQKRDNNSNDFVDVDEKDSDSVDSADQALCEMLGITSFKQITLQEEEGLLLPTVSCSRIPSQAQSMADLVQCSDGYISEMIEMHQLQQEYQCTGVCTLPIELSVPAHIMRLITEQVVWRRTTATTTNDSNSNNYTDGTKDEGDTILRTYETIHVRKKDGSVQARQTLTRLENLNHHQDWYLLCNNYLRRCVNAVLSIEMVLFKSKLNFKPPGGSGFAPHLDAPSLQIALGPAGPQNFVTVMVAIDRMAVQNGCLRVARKHPGEREETIIPVVPPDPLGNPDANGRAGAIPLDVADSVLHFENIECEGGTITLFDGMVPHRSAVNQSHLSRRAVFLTYNPAIEGDCHDLYYERMEHLRRNYRIEQQHHTLALQREFNALDTILE